MNMNSTTAITLNDRFSLIKKPSQTRIARGRSRSRSREPRQRQRQQQQQRGVDLRGSHRNQTLLSQLERQHKMRMALKLKNKSILTTRGRIQGQIARTNMKRATVIRKTMNPRNNLRRNLSRNNLTTFVPLNDAPGRMARGRSRSRSRSRNRIQNIPVQERLGFPVGRRRMRRGGQQQQANGAPQRSRSRSRVRLNRNNFRNGNQVPFKRSNSVNSRLGGNGNGPQNIVQRPQQQQQQIRRRRTRSQSRGNANNVNKRQGNQQLRLNRPLQGRITKRIQRKPGLATVRRNSVGNAIRNGQKLKRGQAGIIRNIRGRGQQRGNARGGRARNRGQQRQNNNNNNNQQGQQQARRGRSRTRRGGNNSRGGKSQVSKETLDKQLDDYMSKGSA